MTTPWISSIRPTLRCWSVVSVDAVAAVAILRISFSRLRQRLGAGDDFHDLLGDRGLALAIELQGEVLDDVARVLGRVAHRGHARPVLGRGGLQQRAVDRDLHVGGDHSLEDRVGARLVLADRAVPAVLPAVLVARGAPAEAV